MIKANELRIGNWVACPKSDFFKYCQVSKRDFSLIDFWENCNPVPLTSEILEACGFDVAIRLDIQRIGIGKISFRYYRNAGVTMFFNDYPGITVEYLHQLQNLYFALTGQELEVQIPHTTLM